MARNGAGTYTVPNTFVASNTITAAGHNQNWADLSAEMTNSVAADGQTTLTAALKGANGAVATPSYSFASDLNTGVYRHGADELGFTTGGVLAGYFDSAQKFWMSGAADIAGLLNLTGALTVGGIATFSATSHLVAPSGTTAQRSGSPTAGMVRYNTTLNVLEFYNGSSWASAAPLAVQGTFKNLSIKVASNTTVTVAADFVVTTDGTAFQSTAVSATVNLGTNGAVNALDVGSIAINTWYSIWVIAKIDGTTGALASTSATAPTLPTGYTFKARVGWVQTINGSATLYGTWQLGRVAKYVLTLAQTTVPLLIDNGVVGTYSFTSPVLVSKSLTRFIPTTASKVSVIANNSWTNLTISNLIVAPSQAYSGTNNGPGGASGISPSIFLTTAAAVVASADILLESQAVSWCSGNSGGALSCIGWEDNI